MSVAVHPVGVCVLVGLLVVFAACDSSENPDRPTLTGQWVGQVISEGDPRAFEMDLTESASVVEGTGTVALSQGTVAFQVTGTYTHPLISLNLQFMEGQRPGSLQGTVSGDRDRITGSASGPGFGGAVELTRP